MNSEYPPQHPPTRTAPPLTSPENVPKSLERKNSRDLAHDLSLEQYCRATSNSRWHAWQHGISDEQALTAAVDAFYETHKKLQKIIEANKIGCGNQSLESIAQRVFHTRYKFRSWDQRRKKKQEDNLPLDRVADPNLVGTPLGNARYPCPSFAARLKEFRELLERDPTFGGTVTPALSRTVCDLWVDKRVPEEKIARKLNVSRRQIRKILLHIKDLLIRCL